jgi:hydrogenase expression/formation protein HypD
MRAASPHEDPRAVEGLLREIRRRVDAVGRPVTLMEVCGTHTHAIAEAGLRPKLKPHVRLISGPGCPVCVTPVDYLDRAEAVASQPGTEVCTFGDLFRVPSSLGSLERASAESAKVRIVYSPRDALELARANPAKKVVFLAVGFETTAPTIVAALEEAERDGVANFFILPGNKVVPPPLRLLAADPELKLDGFLLPGHVSVVTGSGAFAFLGPEFAMPSAVVGFTPADVLGGVSEIAGQVAEGRAEVTNLYGRVVTEGGNATARALMDRYFEPEDAVWRGLGPIPGSGLALRPEWAHRDASRFPVDLPEPVEPAGCRCGEVLKGAVEPPQCPLFGSPCTPDTPVGACMVSSEGTCAAWHRHERHRLGVAP